MENPLKPILTHLEMLESRVDTVSVKELIEFVKLQQDGDQTDPDDWKNVHYRMEAERFDYCWRSYSDFLEVKDPYFHALRKNYIRAAEELEKYVNKKVEALDE